MHSHPSPAAAGGCPHCCTIASPDLLARLAQEGGREQREAALRALAASASIRTQRALVTRIGRRLRTDARTLVGLGTATGTRQAVYDAEHQGRGALPGRLVRAEGDPASEDPAVEQAYAGVEQTCAFYAEVLGRNGIDGAGMEVVSSVHYGVGFDNAMWNGAQMVFGDGSGQLFQEGALTRSLDVIGHELTHAVTERTAALAYSKQSGALNESFSDVMGILVKQRALGQRVEQSDWLIGEGTLVPALGKALRSLAEPGSANAGDVQPAHMRDYRDLPDDNDPANDNGGVHVNSGIPNHAFYLAATALGGHAWEKAGPIWYQALVQRLRPRSQFHDAASATIAVAGELFGEGGVEQQAVEHAWREVGVRS